MPYSTRPVPRPSNSMSPLGGTTCRGRGAAPRCRVSELKISPGTVHNHGPDGTLRHRVVGWVVSDPASIDFGGILAHGLRRLSSRCRGPTPPRRGLLRSRV